MFESLFKQLLDRGRLGGIGASKASASWHLSERKGADVRAFKTNHFARYAAAQKISDVELWEAFTRDPTPNLDFDLGYGLLRRRFARPRKGRPHDHCSVLSFLTDTRGIYLYGFPRAFPDELTLRELETYRDLAAIFLQLGEEATALAVAKGKFIEIRHG